MLKVWGRVNSINVMKVLWCLDELGLDYERVDAGMEHGVVDEPRYRALNPNGKVPTLEDGDLVLWESNVIVRYLSAKYGMGTLCPTETGRRALAEQWMDWQQTMLSADVAFIFWGLVRNRKENQDPGKITAAARRLGERWSILDTQLGGRDYVLGEHLTMADIPIGVAVWRWSNLKIERPSLPNVEAWHERLQQRAPFRKRIMLPLT